MFPGRLISRLGKLLFQSVVPMRPSLSSFCDATLNLFESRRPRTLEELKKCIGEEIATICQGLFQRIIQNFTNRPQECSRKKYV